MMPSPPFPADVHGTLHERLDRFLADCDQVADLSRFGQTFNDLENFFIHDGRKFMQEAFELKLQERINRTEATDEAKQCPECKKKRQA
jgi:hypothetical protein